MVIKENTITQEQLLWYNHLRQIDPEVTKFEKEIVANFHKELEPV